MHELILFFLKHWVLSLGFITVLICVVVNECIVLKTSPKKLAPTQLVEMINHSTPLLLDLREALLYKKSHIIQSVVFLNTEDDRKKLLLQKDQVIVLICATGNHALIVAKQLRSHGMSNIYILHGGISAWREAGLPIIKNT